MSFAIDFGSDRIKAAYMDRTDKVCTLSLPTIAYVPQHGGVLVGELAKAAIAADPAGAVPDLVRRLADGKLFRHGRTVSTSDIAALLLIELRMLALLRNAVQMGAATFTMPLDVDPLQQESLKLAAYRAGFSEVRFRWDSLAAMVQAERDFSLDGRCAVVLDTGQSTRIRVMRRPFNEWRPDWEAQQAPLVSSQEGLHEATFDLLLSTAAKLSRLGYGDPELLLVGGGATSSIVVDILQRGWPGGVRRLNDPVHAMALGALEPTSRFRSDSKEDVDASHGDITSPDGTLCLTDDCRDTLDTVLHGCTRNGDSGRIIRLQLIGERWSDDDLTRVCQALASRSQIVHVQVVGAGALTSEAISLLAELPKLSSVDLSEWRCRDGAAEGLRYLTRLRGLTQLRLPEFLDRQRNIAGVSRRASIVATMRQSHPTIAID